MELDWVANEDVARFAPDDALPFPFVWAAYVTASMRADVALNFELEAAFTSAITPTPFTSTELELLFCEAACAAEALAA